MICVIGKCFISLQKEDRMPNDSVIGQEGRIRVTGSFPFSKKVKWWIETF
ncbi:MAG: hypothetical protein LKK21_04570 [Prevotella sp.]|jgi:hypothetical protein|nr:hypothetical protein [Prevotella sp.]MCI2124910.1 hypothetical protein [Prevotella sp.]